MYALRVEVPRGAQALDIALDSGLSTDADDGGSTTSSDQLAVLPMNEFVLLAKGSDADRISAETTSRVETCARNEGPLVFGAAWESGWSISFRRSFAME